MKKSITILASILLHSSMVSAQQEQAQTPPQPQIHIDYNLASRLITTCASPESTSQNNCNGYVYGVIDALDAKGLSCPGHPNPSYFGRKIKEDIAALALNNSDAISQPAARVIASLLKSYGCLIPLGNYASETGAPEACKDVVTYKDKAPEDERDTTSIWWNIWQCDAWAEDHGNQQFTHDSFSALNNLYTQDASALKEDLWPNKNAPAVCKVFQQDQKAVHDALLAGITGKLSKTETLEKARQAREDFRARLKSSPTESDKAVQDLLACSDWASNSHQTVIALEARQLAYEFDRDEGSLPADIEKEIPACKNAYSEADEILEFVKQHADDERVMPRDVEPYYHRATSMMHCSEQLAKTKYRSAYRHLLLAALGINNLMVTAYSNSEAKLVRSLPPALPGNPIVIKVQNSYQQNSSANHCTGTVIKSGTISNIDWNCY